MAKIGLKQLDNILSGSLQVSGSSGVTGSLSLTGTTSTPNAKILVNSSNSKLNIGNTIVLSDNNNRVGLGDTAPSSPDTELHIKSDNPVITLQRTDNEDKGAIEFQGQGGTVGANIEYISNTNDLSFGTFDGSTVVEKLRLEDGVDGNIKVSGSTQITGSLNVSSSITAVSFIGDGSQLTGITSVTTSSIENLNAGIISGSEQLPSGIISGSSQLPSGIISGSSQLPSGIISGSLQLPSGLISGSTQISESGFVSSSTTNIIEVMTSASYATITPVTGTLYIIQG